MFDSKIEKEEKIKSYLEDILKQVKTLSLNQEFPSELKPFLDSTLNNLAQPIIGTPPAPLSTFDVLVKLERMFYLLDKMELLKSGIDLLQVIYTEAFQDIKTVYCQLKDNNGYKGLIENSYRPKLSQELDTLQGQISSKTLDEDSQFDIFCEIIDEVIRLEHELNGTENLKPLLESKMKCRALITKPQSAVTSETTAPISSASTTEPSSTTSAMTTTANTASPDILNDVLNNSASFFETLKITHNITNIPTANRLNTLLSNGSLTPEDAVKQIESVRIILASALKPLLKHFLENKRKYGSSVEREFYKEMTEEQLILRFFEKRAVVFTNLAGMDDYYLLSDDEKRV